MDLIRCEIGNSVKVRIEIRKLIFRPCKVGWNMHSHRLGKRAEVISTNIHKPSEMVQTMQMDELLLLPLDPDIKSDQVQPEHLTQFV